MRNNKTSVPLKIKSVEVKTIRIKSEWTREMANDISNLVPTDWSEMMERELVREIKKKERAKFMEEFL